MVRNGEAGLDVFAVFCSQITANWTSYSAEIPPVARARRTTEQQELAVLLAVSRCSPATRAVISRPAAGSFNTCFHAFF